MTHAPAITVFTPTYNRAGTLPRVFESLDAQSFRDFEWLVIDDGSTDSTAALMERLRQQATFPIRYIRKHNGGKHTAHNVGIAEARGEFFITLDSDDSCEPHALQTLLDAWNDIPQDSRGNFFGVNCRCRDEQGNPLGKAFPRDGFISDVNEIVYRHGYRDEMWGMLRTDLVRGFPFPEPKGTRFIPEGIIWSAMSNQYRLWYINAPLRIYHQQDTPDSDQLTRTGPDKNAIGLLLWHQSRLTNEIKWFRHAPLTFIRSALHCVRFACHAGMGVAGGLGGIAGWKGKALYTAAILPGTLVYLNDKRTSTTTRQTENISVAYQKPNSTIPANVRMEEISCPLGCPRGETRVLTGFDRLHDLPGEFHIEQCTTCGLMRTNPRPAADSIGFYYPEEYGPYQPVAEKAGKRKKDGLLKSFAKKLLQFNSDVLPPMPKGNLFEVGCGGGFFLKQAAEEGWQVEALEFAESPVQRLRESGYNVHEGTLEAFHEPDARPDLIVAWMVVEHLHDLMGGLRKMRSWIQPNGRLAISVPDEGVLMARLTGNAWFNRQLPTHLYHFTPETITKTLDEAGWKVDRIIHQRVLTSILPSIGYALRDRNLLPGLAQQLIDTQGRNWRWNLYLYPLSVLLAAVGQTGRMTIWASPRETGEQEPDAKWAQPSGPNTRGANA